MKKIIVSSILAIMVCACGTIKKDLGIEKDSPNEMLVVSRAPLSIPPEFGLRPLVAGEGESFEQSKLSRGEQALLQELK